MNPGFLSGCFFTAPFCCICDIINLVMKMIVKNSKNRDQVEIVCIENLVPEEHLLRKIDRAVNFEKIYEFVESCTVQTTTDQV